MGFKCGIVGLPNVGKSTIFNALTNAKAMSENYPFCTIDPNIGKVAVPDKRLEKINSFIDSQKIIPATMEFVDIAGLVKGASRGEGLGNKFLGHIRSVDAIAHITRCFDSSDITHVEGDVNPLRDIDIIDSELIFADNETVENNIKRYEKLLKTNPKNVSLILEMLKSLHAHLQEIKPARSFDISKYKDKQDILNSFRDLHLLTAKPVLFVCNVSEDDVTNNTENSHVKKVKEHAKESDATVIILSGKIEAEISSLDQNDKKEFLEELGIQESGLHSLIREGYNLLGLQTYFTAGEKEIRAWTIAEKTKAPQAAGVIHSDFERGFICSEVYTLNELEQAKEPSKLKELGLLRIEGKDYVVQDGDILEFRFNV